MLVVAPHQLLALEKEEAHEELPGPAGVGVGAAGHVGIILELMNC
jgi:hypothetical protein